VAALQDSKLLNSLPAHEQQAVSQIAQLKIYQAGEVVFKEGDPGEGLFVIGEGHIKICINTGLDQPIELSQLGPGEFFGEMAVLDNEPRSATAIAAEPTELYYITRPALMEQLQHSPALAFSLTRQLSRRIRDFNRQYLREMLQAERLILVGRFARSIVHDFKNPLAIIGLAADMGLEDSATLETRHTARQRVRKQVDRLTEMINELLEFTRVSQATTILALSDYGSFVEQIIKDIQSEIGCKSVTLVWDNPPPTANVLMDPKRLTHVFFNLIHNAVEAMPNGGRITLRFRSTPGEIITEIEDQGPGIPPELAVRLFEPFATFGKPHGTGLGLSICRRIIQDHQGQIEARNEPGRGAVFSFTLPLPAGSRPPE
jgi:signal transduction histidine kinase